MAAVEEVCLICAEPIEYVGVLPCGHKDVCAICCVRLRLVVQDMKCCACQQESNYMLVTRHQGAYTAQITAGESGLKPHCVHMKGIHDIYFDDEDYRDVIQAKCALSCVICDKNTPNGQQLDNASAHGKTKAKGGALKNKGPFNSIGALKAHLKEKHNLFLCDVCLEGRKIFVTEQVLYTRSQLSRHYAQGDLEGPMADAGFKGHPSCHFCKKYFYSDQELYSHMQTKHMMCFICRRAAPDKYTYYRNLKELEDHFRTNHHLCMHQGCAGKHPEERVFANKEEFHVHYVQNHGESLSKYQKKQALQININFPSLRQDRQVYEEPEAQEQRDDYRREHFAEEVRQEEDIFAHLGPSQWRRAVGSSNSGGYNGVSSTFRPTLNMEDYPSLPGTSKSAKKRAKAKAKAASEPKPARELNSAAWGTTGKGKAQLNSTSEEIREKNKLLMQKLRRELDGIVFTAFRQESVHFLEGQSSPQEYYNRLKVLGLVEYASELAEICPKQDKKNALLQLLEEEKDRAKPRLDRRDDSEKFVNLATLLRKSRIGEDQEGNQRVEGAVSTSSNSKPEISTPSDTMHAARVAIRREPNQRQKQQHSEEIKANNKLLMAKLKQELDPDTFAGFRMKSIDYLKGKIDAQDYYDLIIGLGLMELIKDLANLCPDQVKRQALIDLHEHLLQVQMASDSNSSQATQSSSTQKRETSSRQRKKMSKFERRRLGENASYSSIENDSYQRPNVHRVNPNNSWTQKEGRGLF